MTNNNNEWISPYDWFYRVSDPSDGEVRMETVSETEATEFLKKVFEESGESLLVEKIDR